MFELNKNTKVFIAGAGGMLGEGLRKKKNSSLKYSSRFRKVKRNNLLWTIKWGLLNEKLRQCILGIIQTEHDGSFNQVCQDHCDRYLVAQEFIRILGSENEIRIGFFQ